MSTLGDGELLELAFDRARSGLALIDMSGTILRANPVGAAIVGRTPEEVAGIHLGELIPTDDQHILVDALATLPAKGSAGPVDLKTLTPDGRVVWLQAVATLLVVPGAGDGIVYVSFEDVTALHELSARYDEAVAELRSEHATRLTRAKAFADFAALTARSSTDVNAERLLDGIAGISIEHLADLACVVLIDEHDPDLLHVAHVRHCIPEAEADLRERLQGLTFKRAYGEIHSVLHDGGPITEIDGPLHPVLVPLLDDWIADNPVGERHLYPLQSPDGPLGVLVLMRRAGTEPFSPDDVDLAMLLVSRAAVAVQNVRLQARRAAAEAAIEQRRAQQEAVARLGTLALSGVGLDELTDRCRALVEATLDDASCAVLIADEHPDGMLLMAASERFGLTPGELRWQLSPGFAELVVAEGSVLVPDATVEERSNALSALIERGMRCVVITSIESGAGTSGVLTAASPTPHAFAPEDVTFLEAMANVIAGAIDSKHALDDLRHNALHDSLTGLPNRVLVLQRLELALEQAASQGSRVAVLACDVDRFKVVNDGLGHSAGDEVLRQVADRLRLMVRPGDTVGRFGGDEFIIVCPDVGEAASVVAIAERLAHAFSDPIEVLGIDVVVTTSMGIAIDGGTGPDVAQDLLRDADVAMYRAKDRGRNRFELFDDAMRVWASTRLGTENELRRALDHGELVLHYQPILTVDGLTAVGCEALVRWQHPERGLLLPAEFLGVAVESGLILELGDWVFEEAGRQAVRWEAEYGDESWWIAVNLAPRQLSDPRLLERIDGALARTGVDPSRLSVEITEDALIEDTVQMGGLLEALRERGLGISVDDFGTGYSSLAYLKRLPLDALKLDRGFVAGLAEDSDDMVIAAAVIVMAQALGLRVVAEGVETKGQLDVLRAMGCDLAQGFLFSKAQPPDCLAEWSPPTDL